MRHKQRIIGQLLLLRYWIDRMLALLDGPMHDVKLPILLWDGLQHHMRATQEVAKAWKKENE